MTINIGLTAPAPFSASARQARHQAREAKRRQHVVRFVLLAAVARTATDRRTVVGVIVLALGLAAAASLANQRGTPGLDWYVKQGGDKSRSSA
jgi:hypothetical protein